MKVRFVNRFARQQAGYALMLALVFAAISIIILASTMGWTSTSVRLTERNNSYNRAVAAAEAGVETVIARMDRDFLNQSIDYANLTSYRNTTPTTYLPTGWTADYQFSDTNGVLNQTTVAGAAQFVTNDVDSDLPGLYGLVFPCRIASCAKRVGTPGYDVAAGVQQDFQLVSIPIYQFQAFYSLDLEINPGPQMYITGKVHGNADMYLAPGTGLEFYDAVETVGQINYNRMTNDPSFGSSHVTPVFDSTHKGGANSLTLPIGTNNAPSEVVKVLDPPPGGEDPLSPMGSQRYYNQVDLIVTTTSSGVSVKSGRWNMNLAVPADVTNTVPASYSFINTSKSFTDQREQKTVQVTELDVQAFGRWLTNTTPNSGAALNNLKNNKYGVGLNSIYIDDQRSSSSTTLTAVRVWNGRYLPADGLTVATARPLYVMGHYNAPDTTAGLHDTSQTKPASLVADSITVLSGNWNDASSGGSFSSRPAADDTVNAALLAGIVQTTIVGGVKHFSGGMENFPRLLEDWNGRTLTYNGSMVVMFPSRYATSWFISPGTYYNAPTRKWAFDTNYMSQVKLPPVTPQVRKLMRGQWTTIVAAQ